MSTQPNSPSTMVMNVIGREVQATYSILWSSNNTTTNDTGDSCIGVVSSDNSQSPDGTIAPTYHSTPIDNVSPLASRNNLSLEIAIAPKMTGRLNIMSAEIPSLPHFETDSSDSDDCLPPKVVSPVGSTEDLRFNTQIVIDSSDSDTDSNDVSPFAYSNELCLEVAIVPTLNNVQVPHSVQDSLLAEFTEFDINEEPSLFIGMLD